MKKFLFFPLTVFFFFSVSSVGAEEISGFSQEIVIEPDGSILVTETITYDFGNLHRHGIYRDIPYKYKVRGGNYNIRIENISVKDNLGYEYKFSIQNLMGNKRIVIGDANEYVTGTKTYIINYLVRRVINFFEDYDELYWNVTGDAWDIPIKNISSSVIFPSNLSRDDVSALCFSGQPGSNTACSSLVYIEAGSTMIRGVTFSQNKLSAERGLTVVVGWPKDIVIEPTYIKKTIETIKDNYFLLLPLLVLGFMIYLWRERGKDQGGRGTIVTQFDAPNDLSPMAVGTLVDEKADNRDFSSNIISLAIKGYLKIIKLESKKLFEKDDYAFALCAGNKELRKSEKAVLDSIFDETYLAKEKKDGSVLEMVISGNIFGDNKKIEELKKVFIFKNDQKIVFLSSLKNKFYKDLSKIKRGIYQELYEEGYFFSNPEKTRTNYIWIGLAVMFCSWAVGVLMGVLYLFSVLISGAIIFAFSSIMPQKTPKGVLAREHILGLKRYLDVAEKDRINFHNAPEKNPEIFEKLLPYAMVLGVENSWAKQFEDMYRNVKPGWYISSAGSSFSPVFFTKDMESFSQVVNSSASSQPSSASSGGTGFSGGGVGGGFGGGGGGSW